MELFDIHFVRFGQVLAVSGQKTLAIYKPISDKITTVPRLLSEHSLQNENKHQIMNLHTKWNCLVPFLSSMVNYYVFQARKRYIRTDK